MSCHSSHSMLQPLLSEHSLQWFNCYIRLSSALAPFQGSSKMLCSLDVSLIWTSHLSESSFWLPQTLHVLIFGIHFCFVFPKVLHSEHFESTVWDLILLLFYRLFPFIKNLPTICLIFLTLIYFQLTRSNTSTLNSSPIPVHESYKPVIPTSLYHSSLLCPHFSSYPLKFQGSIL